MSSERASRALWVVALLSVGVALWPAPPAELCAAPLAEPAPPDWTLEVRCGEGGDRAALRGPARMLFGLRLDANSASARALETLPGIGPALAGRLVEARAKRAFCRVEDLERVRGIGPVLSSRIAPSLDFAAAECPSGRSRGGV